MHLICALSEPMEVIDSLNNKYTGLINGIEIKGGLFLFPDFLATPGEAEFVP